MRSPTGTPRASREGVERLGHLEVQADPIRPDGTRARIARTHSAASLAPSGEPKVVPARGPVQGEGQGVDRPVDHRGKASAPSLGGSRQGSRSSGRVRTRTSTSWPRKSSSERSAAFWPASSPSKISTTRSARRLAEAGDVVVPEGRAQGADDVGQPRLVGGDHVGIPLDHRHPAGLAGGVAGEVGGVEGPALLEDRRLGGVQVLGGLQAGFGVASSRSVRQDSAAEGDGPAAGVVDREDEAAAEAVAGQVRGSRRCGRSGRRPPAWSRCRSRRGGPAGVSQSRASGAKPRPNRATALGRDPPGRRRSDAPRPSRPARRRIAPAQAAGGQEVRLGRPGGRRRAFVGGSFSRATPARSASMRSASGNSIFSKFWVKSIDVAARPAAPALVRLALGVDFERGGVVVVERAEGLELGAGPVQGEIFANQRDDIDRVLDGGEGGFGLSGHRGLLPERGLRPGSMVIARLAGSVMGPVGGFAHLRPSAASREEL